MNRLTLTKIAWNKAANTLALAFNDNTAAVLTAEYLRVFSPSAEVRGHGGGEPMLVIGKAAVKLQAVEPVGRYALKLVFDDGHDSGLYDTRTLHALCQHQEAQWQHYQARLTAVGLAPDVAEHVAAAGSPKTVRITDVLAAQPQQEPRDD